MELKELSMSLFGGEKRRRGSIHLYFLGDYVDCKNNLSVQKVLHKYNEKKIYFADIIIKIDTKWKSEKRLLLITENAIYNFTATGKKCKLQRRMPLDTVESLSLSKYADNYFVLGLTYPGDKRGDYFMNSVRKAEIVTSIKNALDDKKKTLKLVFSNTLQWKRKKNKIGNAIFQEDTTINPSICVESGNRKTATITINVGMNMCSKAPIQLQGTYNSSRSNMTVASRGGGGGETKSNTSSKSRRAAPKPPASRSSKGPPPAVKRRKEKVKALYDYTASDSDELSIKEGDVLTVITRKQPDAPDGWVKCLFRGKEGLVPDNYVDKL